MKAIIFIIVFLVVLAVSLATTTGIIYAICALLGWHFSLAVATAIWLMMMLLRGADGWVIGFFKKD